nr:hypothetical protein CFP56_52886 [Quercus suber]
MHDGRPIGKTSCMSRTAQPTGSADGEIHRFRHLSTATYRHPVAVDVRCVQHDIGTQSARRHANIVGLLSSPLKPIAFSPCRSSSSGWSTCQRQLSVTASLCILLSPRGRRHRQDDNKRKGNKRRKNI